MERCWFCDGVVLDCDDSGYSAEVDSAYHRDCLNERLDDGADPEAVAIACEERERFQTALRKERAFIRGYRDAVNATGTEEPEAVDEPVRVVR